MWKTTNLSALKSSQYWNSLPEGFKSTIVEEKVSLPLWTTNQLGIPEIESTNPSDKTIIFKNEIDITKLDNLYNYTQRKWIYLSNRAKADQYFGELDQTNKVLTVNNSNFSAGDKIVGNYTKTVKFDDPTISGRYFSNSPAEWYKPVVILDLGQVNDTRTYDGSFPLTITEIKTIDTISSKNDMVIWARMTDLIDIPVGVGDNSKVLELEEKIGELTKKINKIKEVLG